MTDKAILLLITDNKPGHKSQTLGLANAIQNLVAVDLVWFDIRCGMFGLFQKLKSLNSRVISIGAGNATSKYLVLVKLIRRSSLTIHLMKPNWLPTNFFGAVVAPRHDGLVEEGEAIINTEGALNPIGVSQKQDKNRVLILIGGSSKHHSFDVQNMISQISRLCSLQPDKAHRLTTSRRTPDDFISRLSTQTISNLTVFPFVETTPDFVAAEMEESASIWVSEDSVSMIYESLSSGASVGLLNVEKKRIGRVVNGINSLVERGWATRLTDFEKLKKMTAKPVLLRESERVAKILVDRFNLTAKTK